MFNLSAARSLLYAVQWSRRSQPNFVINYHQKSSLKLPLALSLMSLSKSSTASLSTLVSSEMRRQLRRIDGGAHDRALRKALEDRRTRVQSGEVSIDQPLPWWRPSYGADHAAWIAGPVPAPVTYDELTPIRQWSAGQPVILVTQGHTHIAWVRVTGAHVAPRWLSGDMLRRMVCPSELTFRDPRGVWCDPWHLQLGLALLSAETDSRCAWLQDPDPESEPELAALLLLAREELRPMEAPMFTPGPAAPRNCPPDPFPRRAWTVAERDRMRAQAHDGTIEVLALRD